MPMNDHGNATGSEKIKSYRVPFTFTFSFPATSLCGRLLGFSVPIKQSNLDKNSLILREFIPKI